MQFLQRTIQLWYQTDRILMLMKKMVIVVILTTATTTIILNYFYPIVFHRNIQGLKHKANELLSSLLSDLPCIICITECYLNQLEPDSIIIESYILGASCCRKQFLKGGTCIFVHKSIKFCKISINNYCLDHDI